MVSSDTAKMVNFKTRVTAARLKRSGDYFNLKNDKNPVVARLDIYLENHHTFYFREGREGQAENQTKPGTKLTKWLAAN